MAEDRLNNHSLIKMLVKKHGFKKEDAKTFFKEFFLLIEEKLRKDKSVKVKGLGIFKLVEVENRESIDINSGLRFEIPGHTKVTFTPEASLRNAVNKPFAHFETIELKEGVTFEDETPLIPEKTEIVGEKTTKDSGIKAAIIAILLTLTICGGALIFVFYPDLLRNLIDGSGKKTVQIEQTVSILKTDSVISVADTPVTAVTTVTKDTKVERRNTQALSRHVIPVISDSTSYDIVGTKTSHTVKAGETLTRIALRYYGTKDLWPYLVMHNKSKIPNPDRVPVGTTIRIPELKKK